MGVNCSILYCPRLSEIPASVTGGVIYGNGVIKLAVVRGKVKLYIRMQTLPRRDGKNAFSDTYYVLC